VEESSELILFFGRFHPLVLHLPIGFLVIAFLLECLSRYKEKYQGVKPAIGIILFAGAITAVFAAILGLFLSQGGGYNENLLSLHKWLGIASSVVAVIAYVLHRQKEKNFTPALDKAYFSSFTISVLVLMAAGHYGGSLTHGSDYLTQYMPQPMRSLAGLPPKTQPVLEYKGNIEEAVVYKDLIHPIFEARCTSCHNDDKLKGDLKMKTFEDLLAGGENGPALEPGNALESRLYEYITLPEDHDDHMPPDGKKQLEEEQIELIGWWIDQGASTDEKVAALEKSPEIEEALKTLYGEPKEQSLYATIEIEAAKEADIENVKKLGAMVMPLAQESNWLQVTIRNVDDSVASELFTNLNKLSKQVTWLDLGNTEASDQTLEALAGFKNLTRLHLENTEVSDEGLAHLKGLENLEYLNLYGNEITDEGLQHLTSLKKLKKLYLWQTKVSESGIETLKTAIPTLNVDTGLEEEAIKAFTAAKDDSTESVN